MVFNSIGPISLMKNLIVCFTVESKDRYLDYFFSGGEKKKLEGFFSDGIFITAMEMNGQVPWSIMLIKLCFQGNSGWSF